MHSWVTCYGERRSGGTEPQIFLGLACYHHPSRPTDLSLVPVSRPCLSKQPRLELRRLSVHILEEHSACAGMLMLEDTCGE